MSTIKSASFSTVEPFYVEEDGTQHSYVPRTITTARDAFAASLHLVFNHVADFHAMMVTIIAEKYEIPEEEIFEVVRSDPRFSSLVSAPVVQSMGYFDEDELSAAVKKMKMEEEPAAAAAAGAPSATVGAAESGAPQPKEEPKPKKKVLKKPAKKAAVVTLDEDD